MSGHSNAWGQFAHLLEVPRPSHAEREICEDALKQLSSYLDIVRSHGVEEWEKFEVVVSGELQRIYEGTKNELLRSIGYGVVYRMLKVAGGPNVEECQVAIDQAWKLLRLLREPIVDGREVIKMDNTTGVI